MLFWTSTYFSSTYLSSLLAPSYLSHPNYFSYLIYRNITLHSSSFIHPVRFYSLVVFSSRGKSIHYFSWMGFCDISFSRGCCLYVLAWNGDCLPFIDVHSNANLLIFLSYFDLSHFSSSFLTMSNAKISLFVILQKLSFPFKNASNSKDPLASTASPFYVHLDYMYSMAFLWLLPLIWISLDDLMIYSCFYMGWLYLLYFLGFLCRSWSFCG